VKVLAVQTLISEVELNNVGRRRFALPRGWAYVLTAVPRAGPSPATACSQSPVPADRSGQAVSPSHPHQSYRERQVQVLARVADQGVRLVRSSTPPGRPALCSCVICGRRSHWIIPVSPGSHAVGAIRRLPTARRMSKNLRLLVIANRTTRVRNSPSVFCDMLRVQPYCTPAHWSGTQVQNICSRYVLQVEGVRVQYHGDRARE